MHLPRKSSRTRRYLHSTFWSHGASEINLPAWWVMLLRSPQGEEPRWASRRLAAARTILSYVAEVGFLGFLYPSRTLAIVKKIVDRDRAWSDFRQGIRCAPVKLRTFSSIASDSTNATGNNNGAAAQAGSLLSEGPASEPGLEFYSDRIQVDSQLAELFKLPEARRNYERAWHFYQNLQNLSEDLTSQQLENMIRYLITGPAPLSSERVIDLVEKIPFSERDDFHHESVIRAELNRLFLDKAIDYYRKSLQQVMYIGGASLILRFTVEHGEWNKAIETLNDYSYELGRHRKEEVNHQTMWSNIDRSSMWRHVRQLPFSILSQKATAAANFAAKTTAETNAETAILTRRFAMELATEAFSVEVDESIDVEAHRKLFRAARSLKKGLEIQMFQLYNHAISQLLVHKLKNHEKIAVEYYRKVKTSEWVPERQVLHLLLQGFSAAGDSTGIFEVVDDFRRHHGQIPISWHLRIIPALAMQGDAESVHALFKEYVKRGGKYRAALFDPVLRVHNRRAEPHHIVNCFYDLQKNYGFVPTITSWNLVISTYARVGDVEGATTWLDRMVEAGKQPNARTYKFLMHMYAGRGDVEAVQRLFQQSEAAGIKPDLSMIDSLVLVLVKNDMLDDARKLVEEALQIESNSHSRSHMWNYVMDAHAHRGDLVRVKEIHKRMHEAGVPADEDTYSALMRCLTMRRMSGQAHTILRSILPRAGISTTPVQHTTVMSGYFERGEYQRVLQTYSRMLKKKLTPTPLTKTVLLRSVAALERQQNGGARQPKELVRTLALFKQIITNMNPAELAPKGQAPFGNPNRLDEAYTSMNFSHLIFLYGREAAFDKVRELYDQYLATALKVQGTIDFIPPIELLSALLSANAEARDYGEADRCWDLAVEKAKQLARPSAAVDGKPWRALYSRRLILNLPLPIYMICLEKQDKIDHITTVVENLLALGFEFHNNTWNAYVQILARNGREKLAFSICERELMDQWYGWESLGHRLHLRRRFENIRPDGVRPTKRFPDYQTLVYLAAAFIKARSKGVDAPRELAKVAPRAMNAVSNMPKLDDDFQYTILGSAENIDY